MQKKIIFIHGFGVRKDARGMFVEIANALPEYKSIFTDLNIVDDNNTHLNPLSKQAEILSDVYQKEKENSEITVVAHSQGCVVASMINFIEVKQIILLCPPTNNDLEKTINSFKKRNGTEINPEGISILMRKDGTKTFVPKEYWDERERLNYLNEYKKLINKNVTIILAKQDEIISNEGKDELSKIGKVLEINGNHNFDGIDRHGLLDIIKFNLPKDSLI